MCSPHSRGSCQQWFIFHALQRQRLNTTVSVSNRPSSILGMGTPNRPIKNRMFMPRRSEEHTSELQSRGHLVCRLLLEKKEKKRTNQTLVEATRTQEAKVMVRTR